MVIATIGMIAMIAVPRITSAAMNTQQGALIATTDVLQRSIELYTVEHSDRSPAVAAGGALDMNGAHFVTRLLSMTDESGGNGAGAIFGPYLRSMARNVLNGLSTVRIDGAPAGAGTHGWRFDTPTGRIEPDDAAGVQIISVRRLGKLGGAALEADGKLGGAAALAVPAAALGE